MKVIYSTYYKILQWKCLFQCQSQMAAGGQPHKGVWPLWLPPYITLWLVPYFPNEGLCSARDLPGGGNISGLWKRPWTDSHLLARNVYVPTEVETWIKQNNDPSVRCRLKSYQTNFHSPDKEIQAHSTMNKHFIASGTDEKKTCHSYMGKEGELILSWKKRSWY